MVFFPSQVAIKIIDKTQLNPTSLQKVSGGFCKSCALSQMLFFLRLLPQFTSLTSGAFARFWDKNALMRRHYEKQTQQTSVNSSQLLTDKRGAPWIVKRCFILSGQYVTLSQLGYRRPVMCVTVCSSAVMCYIHSPNEIKFSPGWTWPSEAFCEHVCACVYLCVKGSVTGMFLWDVVSLVPDVHTYVVFAGTKTLP